MRIRTHGVATAAALALMSACATAPAPASESTTANAELSALRTQQLDQTKRIAELEARLSLLEADARRARDDDTPLRSGDAVRIGPQSVELTSHVSASQEPAVSDDELDGGKRPSLRLYGNSNGTVAAGGGGAKRASLPAIPEVSERLPVVPLPEQRAAKVVRGAAASSEGALPSYRKGLRALQERRYDEALMQFAAFVEQNPRHDLVASALYWRGEALYAKRDYNSASKEFEALLERFPAAARVPDALLKLGLSLRKLGARDQADDAFLRLRTDYPNSQAAEAAAREGST
ncbi:MAG TPA: tol-pal system protein YbgF [Polyangiales bacterium]|nr:tol-pal system protein YbgF [Polyangiales bacterium]